ncbi:MAG: RNA-directed DNA polymerase, partial [Candidatus Saccharimonadales bacterium]
TDRQTDRQHGIPIGNLTSQIFANIYLNEFDRYVRHELKPLAYIRYGDDFVLFCDDKTQAEEYRRVATQWLANTLRLTVHTSNDVVVRATQGLRYLGHSIYPDSALSVDKVMLQKIRRDISPRNAASYQAMALPRRKKMQLPWWLLG